MPNKTPYFPSDNWIQFPVKTVTIPNLSPKDFRKPIKDLAAIEQQQKRLVFEEKIVELAAHLKQCEDNLTELRRNIWRERRKIIIEVEKLGGIGVVDCATFTEFCKRYFDNPSKSRIATYVVERQAGRFELLLEIPLCSYGASFYKPLMALELFKKPELEERVPHFSSKLDFQVSLRKLELLKMAWQRTLEIAKEKGSSKIKGVYLFYAVQELHFRYPEEVKLPRIHNYAAQEKLKMTLLEKENEQLKLRNAELERKIAELERRYV